MLRIEKTTDTDSALLPSLEGFRERSHSRFKEEGVPTVKNEEWKYTNLTPLAQHKYHLLADNKIVEAEDFLNYISAEDINIVFVNGIFSEEYSSLKNIPDGITIGSLKDIVQNKNGDVTALLEKYDLSKTDAFTALNSAFLHDGAFVRFSDKVVSKDLIHIVHVTSGGKADGISFPRSLIAMGKSSEATILETHIAFNNEARYFTNAVSDIFLEENARLVYSKAQAESLKSFHIGGTRVWQAQDSHFDSFSLMIGATLTRNNLSIILDGTGAHATLNGLYVNDGDQHVDNHTMVDHRPPNCTSSQLYKGILNERARAVFNGKIFVHKEAQQTNSYQLNKNLLLGKDCRVDTKPQLEIFADDVRCTHGATIGQLNPDEIFYLQTRGIPKEQAIKMLCRGFVDEIIDRISSEAMRQKLRKLLTRTSL